MYGPGKAWTDAIRELNEEFPGRLKALDPKVSINRMFPALNDIRLPMANPPPPREHELKPVKRFWGMFSVLFLLLLLPVLLVSIWYFRVAVPVLDVMNVGTTSELSFYHF